MVRGGCLALLSSIDIDSGNATPEVSLLVFLERIVPNEVVPDTAFPPFGIHVEVVERIFQLNSFVDLLECEPVRRGRQNFVDQDAVVLVWLLQLFLGIILPAELERRRLGFLAPLLLDGLFGVRGVALFSVLLARFVLALLGSIRGILRKRMLPRPTDLAFDWRLSKRLRRLVLFGKLHGLLFPKPLFSLRHDAVLGGPSRTSFLGRIHKWYAGHVGELWPRLRFHRLRLRAAVTLVIFFNIFLLDRFHDMVRCVGQEDIFVWRF